MVEQRIEKGRYQRRHITKGDRRARKMRNEASSRDSATKKDEPIYQR